MPRGGEEQQAFCDQRHGRRAWGLDTGEAFKRRLDLWGCECCCHTRAGRTLQRFELWIWFWLLDASRNFTPSISQPNGIPVWYCRSWLTSALLAFLIVEGRVGPPERGCPSGPSSRWESQRSVFRNHLGWSACGGASEIIPSPRWYDVITRGAVLITPHTAAPLLTPADITTPFALPPRGLMSIRIFTDVGFSSYSGLSMATPEPNPH